METFAYLQVAQTYEQFEEPIEEAFIDIDIEDIQNQLLARSLFQMRHSKMTIGLLCLSSAIWATASQAVLAVEDFDPSFGSRAADTGYTEARGTTVSSNQTRTVVVDKCNGTNTACTNPCNSPVVYPTQPNTVYVRPTYVNSSKDVNFVAVRPEGTTANEIFLRRGDSGETVRQLQELLRSAGYFDAAATGFFASLTESGVKAFQRDQGLSVDGIVGETTWAALGGRPYRPITSTTPPVTPGIPVGGASQLRIGDRGPYVADLQLALRQFGFYSGPITGIYEATTEQAVIAFQRSNNLAISGIADEATLDRLGLGGYSA